MAGNQVWTVSAEKKSDWERMVDMYGYCEVVPDMTKAPEQMGKNLRDWALKRRLACIEGDNLVVLDPRRYNPKDSLDRGRFGFLARYFRARDIHTFERDIETTFNIHSVQVIEAIRSYWAKENVTREMNNQVSASHELLRLMGFSSLDLLQALDGVVKKEYLAEISGGEKLLDPTFGQEFGHYLVNFDIVKDRFFDAQFVLQAAGQPIPLKDIGSLMGVEDMNDLKSILKEARRKYDLDIQVNEDHVMFGAPSQASVDALIAKQRATKDRLSHTETQLKDRSKTIKDLLGRYSTRETKILNEVETFKEEGRLLWIKSKIAKAIKDKIDGVRG